MYFKYTRVGGTTCASEVELGEKFVAMINEVESDPAAGDISDLIKVLADKDIEDFELCNGVRVVVFLV